MCGYLSYDQRNITDTPELFGDYAPLFQQRDYFEAYPAFGGDTRRRIPLLINESGEHKWVEAIWWFDAYSDNNVTYLGRRTSFNARNLQSPFWSTALKQSRGCVIASEIGESKIVGQSKHQYLLSSETPFLLGALYRKLDSGDYCCAVITRDAHPKMAPYHDKAFPLFLPINADFLSLWLDSRIATSPEIECVLKQAKLYPSLHVQRVKTYKHKQPIGPKVDVLISDLEQSADDIQAINERQQSLF